MYFDENGKNVENLAFNKKILKKKKNTSKVSIIFVNQLPFSLKMGDRQIMKVNFFDQHLSHFFAT